MKNLLLGSALALSTLAVIMPTQNAMAQEVATVGSIGDGLTWLGKRIQTIDVGTLAYDMELDGVTSREFVAVFSIDGAIIQNYELFGDDGLDEVGRKPGMQFLPYKVSVTNDGRKFISVGIFSMKEMNKAYGKVESEYGRYNGGDEPWTVINRIDALVFEYDDSMEMNNTIIERLDIVRTELKVDILGSSKPGHFLAVVGQASLGFERQTIMTPSDRLILATDDEEQRKVFNAKYGIGLEYNLPMGKTGNLNTSVMLNGAKIGGQNYSQIDQSNINAQNEIGQQEASSTNETNNIAYEQQLQQYQSDKAEYEYQNLGGVSISQESYYELTGAALPLSPEVVRYDNIEYKAPTAARTYMYLSPSINYSGKLGDRTRFEVNVFGNIPFRDDLKTNGVKLDLTGTNTKPIVGAGIKLKF